MKGIRANLPVLCPWVFIYGQPLNDHGQEAAAKADAFFGMKVAAD